MLLHMIKNNRLFAIGLVICGLWVMIAILAPWIAPHDPLEQNVMISFRPPSLEHLCGTDVLGRDVLSRTLVGSRVSIGAAMLTVIFSALVGGLFGGLAGYIGGLVDEVMMRISELVQSFPTIILAMVICAALGPSLVNALLAMVVVWWPSYARVMRSMVITVKSNEYIEASKSLGASSLRIFFREILPNSVSSIIVLATVDFGNAILLFAGLSFLGLGSPPPAPEWGSMVSDGAGNFYYWWIATFPGLGILTMSMGANFIGDGMRDFLDPKLRKEL